MLYLTMDARDGEYIAIVRRVPTSDGVRTRIGSASDTDAALAMERAVRDLIQREAKDAQNG